MTPVRLRTDDTSGELCQGYCERTGEWRWYSNDDITGAVTAKQGTINDLGAGDDQENYWWVITPKGERIGFQSIDVEEITNMKRYRSTMTITIDVLANDEREATQIAGDSYFDWDHFWTPESTVEIPADDPEFFAINDPDDYI